METEQTEDEPTGQVARRDRDALGEALIRKFHEDCYTDEYLARRCRATVDEVAGWKVGTAVPTHAHWWYLLRIHNSFRDLTGLWRRAAEEAGQPIDDPRFVGDRRELTHPRPAMESGMQVGPTSPSTSPSTPAERSTTDHDRQVDASAQPSSELTIRVPDGFVVYRCRITRGRILEIPLPVDLGRADVDRLCAFLQTQADE